MPPPIKEGEFKSFDGTPIHYRIAGKEKRILLCFNGIGVSKWVWRPLEEYFADRFRIITFDWRGHGESGRPKQATKAKFNDLVEDALSLINTLNIKKACLIGHSSGFHAALEVVRKKMKIADVLISCLGAPGRALENFMNSFWGKFVFDVGYIVNAIMPNASHWINSNLLSNPLTYQIGAALKLTNPAIGGKKEVSRYIDNFARIDFSLFNHLMADESKQGAEVIFPRIKVPTLLIASEQDKFVPLKVAQKMHAEIKKSELFVIKNGTHAALFEQPDIFNLKIEQFLEKKWLVKPI